MKRFNSWDKVLDALTEPMHSYQLAPLVHLEQRTVARILRDLHIEGLVHVRAWVHRAPPGPYTPVYAYGPGEDARCPRPMTSAEKARKHRARLTVSQREAILQRRRVVKRDLAASWI